MAAKNDMIRKERKLRGGTRSLDSFARPNKSISKAINSKIALILNI